VSKTKTEQSPEGAKEDVASKQVKGSGQECPLHKCSWENSLNRLSSGCGAGILRLRFRPLIADENLAQDDNGRWGGREKLDRFAAEEVDELDDQDYYDH
jgi:hypothetical protein